MRHEFPILPLSSRPSAKQHMRRRPLRSLQMPHNCLAIAREGRFGFERIQVATYLFSARRGEVVKRMPSGPALSKRGR